MAKIGIIFGLPGSGKSTLARHLQARLREDGVSAVLVADKEYLETEVWRDVGRFISDPARRVDGGGILGDHSILLNPEAEPGTLQIQFIDGYALNAAHAGMFQDLARFQREAHHSAMILAEIAYGKDVKYRVEPLRQTGSRLLFQMAEFGILAGDVHIIEVVSTMEERLARNSLRPGHIPTREFRLYFPEEGHPAEIDRAGLSDHRYVVMPNMGTDTSRFLGRVTQLYDEQFRPWVLEGRGHTGEFGHRGKESEQ